MANKTNATTKSSDSRIRSVLRLMDTIEIQFYMKTNKRNIIIKNLEIDAKGRLYHQIQLNGIRRKVLASKTLQSLTGYPVRWLNHLWFKDGQGNCVNFKKYMTEHFDCIFT